MHTLSQLHSGELKGTKALRLSCGLTVFPSGIFELADTLELLDLTGNELSSLPQGMDRFKKLKIILLSNNAFVEFPNGLKDCPSLEMIGLKANRIESIEEGAFPPLLRWLILTDNRIASLPLSIGKCRRLQKLMLAGNKLKNIPEEMANCQNLELLRLSANEIDQLPDWLFSLKRLSWLAYSGNPCAVIHAKAEEKGITIEWSDLVLLDLLGEGASGHISKAIWKGEKEVAVKLYKGAVTSDGLPEDEMSACLSADTHAHLVPVLGKVKGHPAGKQALLLEFIPTGFKNLGGPPSFETCTRDTFKEGTFFSPARLVKIAKGMASVSTHLHSKGIMHGDLYAHNILVDENDHVLFGDFGAATRYHRTDAKRAFLLERVEVRAFGSLLDDLLPHAVSTSNADLELVTEIKKIRDACWDDLISQRPDFEEIGRIIERW